MAAANSLTRLVERTMGRTPVVQPRVTPMFAPEVPNVTGNTMDEVTETVQSKTVQTSQPLSQNKNKTAPTLFPEPVTPVFNEPAPVINKPIPTPVQEALKADAVPTEKPGIKEELPVKQSAVTKSQASPEQQPDVSSESVLSVLSVPSVPSDLSVLSDPSPVLVPGWQPAAEEVQSKSPQIPVRLVTKKEEKTGAVRVTIGRVEVRAVFQQPSVPRAPSRRVPAAPKPVLSLDKYLQMRNGGKR